MTLAGEIVLGSIAGALIGYVANVLAGELRASNQLLRSRVAELERDRDELVAQLAASQGVALGARNGKLSRSWWTDPAGYQHFDDGEVRDPEGQVVVAAGELAEPLVETKE